MFISALIEALVKHRLKDEEVEDDEPGNAGMGEIYIRSERVFIGDNYCLARRPRWV